jgi:hypothetical protein
MNQTPQPKRSPHLRLSAEQIKAKWLIGDYTAQGYLFDLLKSSRKDGWHFAIDDVDAFCEEWQISRRSFYRAKAKLILQGRIEEKIVGRLELWIEPNPKIVPFNEDDRDPDDDNPGTDCAKFGTDDDNSGTDCANTVTATPLKPLSEERSQLPSDLSQILNHLSLYSPPSLQPEREILDFDTEIKENTKIDERLDLNQPELDQPDQPKHLEAENKTLKINSSQNQTVNQEERSQVPPRRDDDEFLDFVLRTEVKSLPNPPVTESQQRRLARSLIVRDADVGDLRSAFTKYQQQRAEIDARLAGMGSTKLEVLPDVPLPKRTLGSYLIKLQGLFEASRQANTAPMKAIRDSAISQALKLGFLVTDTSIELADGQHPEQEVQNASL